MVEVLENFHKDLDLAVKILKTVGCREIFIFGPVASGIVEKASDIDLAVKGCPPHLFFQAWGQLLTQLEHSINLVDLDDDDALVKYIKKRGDLRRVAQDL